MPYDINESLERLEQNLQNLDSARRQVENTVNASDELRKVVMEYVDSITKLYHDIQDWENQLKQSQTYLSTQVQDVFATLKTSCVAISERFKSSIEKTIDKYSDLNTVFAEHINELSTLRQEFKIAMSEVTIFKDTLTNLSNVLNESQQWQDQALANIIKSISEVPVTIKRYTDDVVQQMDERHQTFNQKIDNATTKIESIIQKQTELSILCTDIQATCNNLLTVCRNINEPIDGIKKQVDGTQTFLFKNLNINRWIMIAGIIILAVLYFVK